MKIESNNNLGTLRSFFSSLSFTFVVTSCFCMVWFLIGLIIYSANSVFFFNYLSVMLDVTVFVILLSLFGHIFYFNFDTSFRRRCVVCGCKQYTNYMTTLYDKDALERVYMCYKHKIIEVN